MTSQPPPATAAREPTAEDLRAALQVVRAHLEPTPVVALHAPDQHHRVLAKLETTQPTGAFKVRGALAAVSAYQHRGSRIVTASAGNHGLGIAYAATKLHAAATVVVPQTASPAKIDALRHYDIELILHGAGYDDAERHALELAARDGIFVSAYNDRHVIAGQATIAAELAQQIDGPITVVVPVGGGGLASGISLAAARCVSPMTVVGVEADASRAVSTAVTAGHISSVAIGETLADGLAGNIDIHTVTPSILRAAGTPLVAVGEDAIRAAITDLASSAGLVVEGSAAVGWAAVRAGLIGGHGDGDGTTVVVLTGRNIARARLADLLR